MAELRIPCPHCKKELKVKDPALLGRKAKCPACEHRFVLEWTSVGQGHSSSPASAAMGIKEPGGLPAIEIDPSDGLDRIKALQRRERRSKKRTLAIIAVCLVALAGGLVVARPYFTPKPPRGQHAEPLAASAAGSESPVAALPVAFPDDSWVSRLSPTDGTPIELKMVPSGARLLINLRPAELWSDQSRLAELRASLTEDLTGWLESSLREVCRFEPAEIEEVLLAWILGARGTEPQLAAVVHLAKDARMSDLLDRFGHEAIDEFAQPKVYQKGDHATLILDTRTFAIAPKEYGSELAEWVETANYNTSDGIIEVLKQTDRERLLTVVFEPADVQRHLPSLVNDRVQPTLSLIAEWFAADAETVAWSLHTGESFHSEILARGPRTVSAVTVEGNLKARLESVPHEMADLVRRMRPQRSGFRQLIGRFPAMIEVSRQATISGIDERTVRLVTAMPPKAAPNLALGAILTWDESTRTAGPSAAPGLVARTQTPANLVERLQLTVDAEFNRVPLQEALDYIAGEIDAAVEIDGDALKDAGFTKNMAQTFDLGEVPAARALGYIVGQYREPGKEMVIVLDGTRNTLVVTTRKFADRDGLRVHNFET